MIIGRLLGKMIINDVNNFINNHEERVIIDQIIDIINNYR